MLSSLLVAILIHFGEACVNNTEYFGTLDSALAIGGDTLLVTGSCHCCALCHHNPACKSFSLDIDNNGCTLYGQVGGYRPFSRENQSEENTQFFFMPSSSATSEFCRSDSDCVTPGDSCRGRICTTDTTVTCRDVYEMNNALPDHRYWGFVDGREIFLYCRMEQPFNGATLLLSSHYPSTQKPWTTANRLNLTYELAYYPNEDWDFSIIGYADIVKNSSDEPTYDVFVIGMNYYGNPTQVKTTRITAPKIMSLLSTEVIKVEGHHLETLTSTPMAFPHQANHPNALYSAGMTNTYTYSLIRAAGRLWWTDANCGTVVMYIRE